MATDQSYLPSAIKQFTYYKLLAERAFDQVDDDALFWQGNENGNSIAVIVNHLAGNMRSRWTDFLTSDGEKEWRNRDSEFEANIQTREEMMQFWEIGWTTLFQALSSCETESLETIVYIRNQGHTVVEAINRQMMHYAYHIGQIVFIAKMMAGDGWDSLSIPKGQSKSYNDEKFGKDKQRSHFTDEFLSK